MQEVGGSIPPISTRQRDTVQRLGVIAVWVGILATAVGLIVGFVELFGGDESGAGPWLGLVPAGFALILFGIAATQLTKR